MGLSSKKTKTTSQETVGPNAAYAPQINDAAATLRPAYDESLAVSKQFQPGLLAASQYYGDTLGGKYLDGNPYVDGMIEQGDREITDQVNGQFNSRFGSGYHAKALTRGLADNRTRLRFGNYENERGYQNEAGRNLAGVGTTATALAGLPAEQYAQNVNGLLGRYMTSNGKSSTTQSSGVGGLAGGLLGSALSAWAGGGLGSIFGGGATGKLYNPKTTF